MALERAESMAQRIGQWVALVMLLASGAVTAQTPTGNQATGIEENAGRVLVYQQNPLMKKGRADLSISSGVSANDQAFIHMNTGLGLRYHFSQRWSLAATYHKYFRGQTGLEDTLTQEYGIFPERKFRDFYAGLDVAWAPLDGKMLTLESAINQFDVYFILGAGVMQTFTQGLEGELRPSGNLGFGSRIYLTGWCSLNVEVRDYIYQESLARKDSIYQDWVMALGVSFFLPPTYEYRYPK